MFHAVNGDNRGVLRSGRDRDRSPGRPVPLKADPRPPRIHPQAALQHRRRHRRIAGRDAGTPRSGLTAPAWPRTRRCSPWCRRRPTPLRGPARGSRPRAGRRRRASGGEAPGAKRPNRDDVQTHDLRLRFASEAVLSGENLPMAGRILGGWDDRATENPGRRRFVAVPLPGCLRRSIADPSR